MNVKLAVRFELRSMSVQEEFIGLGSRVPYVKKPA